MDGSSHPAQLENQSLSLVIPAYNEEAGIAQAIVEADETLSRFGCPYEILVVDDGSRDGTAEVVRAMNPDRPAVRLIQHSQNQGYGAALRIGLSSCPV